ncbi:MAG: disulfide bond formation protein B, partial [Rhizobiales bacterium]|nr:disulfide bond formation protein B [Hyphomicrobiales bacterium]
MPKLTAHNAALLVALGAAATIAGAWWFEFIAGLEPCPLCLEQRLPFYVGIPVAVVAFVLARSGRMVPAGILLAGVALIMVYGAGLGIYHSGIEWEWWAGPAACSGGGEIPGDVGALLE